MVYRPLPEQCDLPNTITPRILLPWVVGGVNRVYKYMNPINTTTCLCY